MKQMSSDYGDIFGPSRTTRQYSSYNRPSMIPPKYRQKEERRKVLKTSISKMKKIEDPESSLWRSVLINNTVKRLQDETRIEKLQKQSNYSVRYYKENYCDSSSKIGRNQVKNGETNATTESGANTNQSMKNDVSIEDEDIFNTLVDNSNNTDHSSASDNLHSPSAGSRSRITSRKRSFSDLDEYSVQDVLSHFYMPPTPTMLTCIDDYEDVKVADESSKRLKIGSDDQSCDSRISSQIDSVLTNFSADNSTNKNVQRLRHFSQSDSDTNSFGCGAAFLLGEFRNNTYQNLITSLES
ncbi:uncharacterized protein [Leptinotarsa decemlineata]|uniref:uncharacterized protein n=1 Tax=Leptinotarsa decemlineata TaxID=7539 RepID=UPI003D3081F4